VLTKIIGFQARAAAKKGGFLLFPLCFLYISFTFPLYVLYVFLYISFIFPLCSLYITFTFPLYFLYIRRGGGQAASDSNATNLGDVVVVSEYGAAAQGG